MADAPRKPKAIMLVGFEEEQLASGRKLLHCDFQDRYGDWRYRWTAPWRDKDKERGVERLFFKALETEEYNDPQGPWDEELKKLAEEIPSLGEYRLPIQVECSEWATVPGDEWMYKFGVSIKREDGNTVIYDEREGTFRVEGCDIHYGAVKAEFMATLADRWGLGMGKIEQLWGHGGYSPEPDAVSFTVWIPRTLDRQHYRIVGREVVAFVRSHLRRVLMDYESIKRGFQDQ